MAHQNTPDNTLPKRMHEIRLARLRSRLWISAKILFAATFLLTIFCGDVHALDNEKSTGAVNIHVFWSKGCIHCKKALRFLEDLEAREQVVRVIRHEVTGTKEDMELFLSVAKHFDIAQPGVPLFVIGSQFFLGYGDDATTGQTLRAEIMQCQAKGCDEILLLKENTSRGSKLTGAPSLKRNVAASRHESTTPGESAFKTIRLPLVGEMEWHTLSLPVLTILLAAADGFNPCAMRVLVFLLGLLVGVENRWRRFMLGGAFVMASAIVYYLIMTAWLNALLFFGMVIWIRMAIGGVALGVGAWSLREFFINPGGTCKVTAAPARRAVLDRLKTFALSPNLILALVGMVLLAFAVNIVELLCSAGIPATYTQVLALNNLSSWQYHAYIGLYVLVFMLDDLLIFTGAMLAMEVTGLGTRYSRWARLFGGVILMAVGVMMIAKPEWLM
ncbi:MAG: hypothetical protein C4516_05280 [Oxalobacter sp.]|nr:MAG: hypothetical protein C4516_05280 [Oxalobacter sp.]